jgi:IgA peptidase M64
VQIQNRTWNRRRKCCITILLILFHGALAQAGVAEPDYWQVIFTYDSDHLTLIEAAEIAPMKKKVRTPGLKGAPGIIDCSFEWLDERGKVLTTTETQIPVGKRTISSTGDSPGYVMPQSGTIVIRLAGPKHGISAPKAIRLEPTGSKGLGPIAQRTHKAFRDLSQKPLSINRLKRTDRTTKVEGPLSATKIRDTGDDGNRLVMVFMGDGYTAANLSAGDFDADVANLTNAFLGNNSWGVFFDGTNIYQVDVESNEEGADEDRDFGEPSDLQDTYFNSTFWTLDIERLLSVDQIGGLRAIAAADGFVGTGVWDVLALLVNSERYGGSGGEPVVTSVNTFSSLIMIHEIGHSFAGLADEYTDPFPTFPPGDPEPNVDFDFFGPSLKWSVWVDPRIPLPTPDEPQYDGEVGAFEGARYLTTGIYRPTRDCLMRSLGNPVFCQICNEAHILEYFDGVSLSDNTDPPPGSIHKIEPGGMEFSIAPLPIDGFEYEWSVGGQVLPDAVKSSLELFPSDVTPLSQELQVVVSFPSPHVRLRDIERTYSWFVQDAGSPAFTRTPTRTDTPTITPSPTVTFTLTPTVTETSTATETSTSTVTDIPTISGTPTPTVEDTQTITATNTPTVTGTLTFEQTRTPTVTETLTSAQTQTPTVTGTLTSGQTQTPTVTGTLTFERTQTPTVTNVLAATSTETPTETPPVPVVDYDLNDDTFINSIDLSMYLFNIESGSEENANLFDFSLFWKN